MRNGYPFQGCLDMRQNAATPRDARRLDMTGTHAVVLDNHITDIQVSKYLDAENI